MEDMVAATLEVAKELWFCTSKEQVTALFEKHSISSPTSKVALLRAAMQVEESFYAPNDSPLTAEEEFEDELASFIAGSWRLLAV
jgi:hypothetical protein